MYLTFAETLQSLMECTVLPQRLHFPWKKASASSFLGEALFGHWFLAWLRFCAFWVFLFTVNAFSLLCSLQRLDLSHPCASFLMNCQVTPTLGRRSSCLNWGERQCVINTMAIISCWVMSLRSHSSAISKILLEYATIPSPCSYGSLKSSILLASRGCCSAIQSAIMSIHEVTSSSLGSCVNTGVLSLMRLYRCCSSSRSTQPEMVACCPGMLVTPTA